MSTNIRPSSYVSNLIHTIEECEHFGLDHLEVTFLACSDSILEFAKMSHGTCGDTKFKIREKSSIVYPLIFTVGRSRGYEKVVRFKYDFKGGQVDELFEVHFARPGAGYPNKAVFHGKFFRYCHLLDRFDFEDHDILNFIQRHFIEPKLREFHTCIDIKLENRIADKGFLADVYQEARCLRFGNDTGSCEKGADAYLKAVIGSGGIETIYDCNPKMKNNASLFTRIYNKTLEIEQNNVKHLYYSILLEADTHTVFRFEVEFRQEVASVIPFDNLKDYSYLLGLLITRLSKTDFHTFNSLQYDTILTKRAKVTSTIGGGDLYKLDISKKERDLKVALTYYSKHKTLGVDIADIYRMQMEEGVVLDNSRQQEFLMYYKNTLDTISIFLNGSNVRYLAFSEIISGHIEYIEKGVGIKFKVFLNVVGGYINTHLKEFTKTHHKNFILMAYVFYKRNIQFIDDRTLFFLQMFDREAIMDFGDKYLKKEMALITANRSYQVILKEAEKNSADPDFILKLIQIIESKDNYS